jgi:hypothetical protein
MASLAEIRAQYPQYDDLSDEQLADAMHRKFYSDMPREQFDAKIGLAPDPIEGKASALADQWEKLGGQSGAGELFGNSFTLGLKDKVAGLAGGVGGLLTGEGFREGYNTSRRAQEIMEERARERSGNLGKAAEIGGAVTTGVLAHAPAAATALGRAWQTGKEAGKLGLVQGVGDSQSDTWAGTAGDALASGTTGLVAGSVLSGMVDIGRGAFNAGRATLRGLGSIADDETGRAGRKVFKALSDDGVTPERAAARMNNRGTALINVADENVLGLARAASAKPGEGRRVLNSALDAQQRNSQGRVLQSVENMLGGGDVPFNRRLAQMIQTRGQNGNRLYEAAFQQNFRNGHSLAFDRLARRVPGEAVRNAQRIAQAEGRPFGEQLVASISDAGEVTFRREPSLREWHYIQRGLRSATDAAYRNGIGEVGTAYRNLHREILNAMDAANPTYRQARRAYATESEMVDALRTGREILNPANVRNVDQLADGIAQMSNAEREVMRIGLARQMQDMLQTTPDAAGDMVKKIFGNQAKRNAIRAVFGNDREFRAFQAQMANIAKEAKSFQYVRTGSRTSFVDAEKQDAGILADAASGAVDMVTGTPVNTTLRAASKLLKDLGGMDEGVAREVARILVERDPNVVLRALTQSSRRAQNQTARNALLQRAAPIARALSVGGGAEIGSQMVVP